MQPEPKMGPNDRMPLIPAHGRVRPEEIMRRKLMQKMAARRERRIALATAVRRAV
jgi:hypothetical protein